MIITENVIGTELYVNGEGSYTRSERQSKKKERALWSCDMEVKLSKVWRFSLQLVCPIRIHDFT